MIEELVTALRVRFGKLEFELLDGGAEAVKNQRLADARVPRCIAVAVNRVQEHAPRRERALMKGVLRQRDRRLEDFEKIVVPGGRVVGRRTTPGRPGRTPGQPS